MSETKQSPLAAKASTSAAALDERLKALTASKSAIETNLGELVAKRRQAQKDEDAAIAAKRAEIKGLSQDLKKETKAELAALSQTAAEGTSKVSETAAQHAARQKAIVDEMNARIAQAQKDGAAEIAKLKSDYDARLKEESQAITVAASKRTAVVKTVKQLARREKLLKAVERDTIVSRIVVWAQEQYAKLKA